MSSDTLILVVTDEAPLADLCRSGFPQGHDVRIVGDALLAMEAMRYLTPDLVVVDIQTHNAGGYGLCREMANDGRLATVPVLMLIERPQDRWLASQAGAARVLTRPIDAVSLTDEAEALIHSH